MGNSSRGGRFAAALTAAVVLLVACDDGDGSGGTLGGTAPPAVEVGPVAATELVTGDCLVGIVIGREERTELDAASVVECSSRHDLEVFTTFELTPEMVRTEDLSTYPGRGRVISAAEVGCNDALEATGIDTDLLGAIAFWPSATSWPQGDRDVACAIYLQSGRQFEGRQLRLQADETDEDDEDDGA